jgi:hypothetical protein
MFCDSDVLSLEGEVCPSDVPCFYDHSKNYEDFINSNKSSLTNLNGLNGATQALRTDQDRGRGPEYLGTSITTTEGSGAEFRTVDFKTPYYEYMINETVDVPWLAKEEDKRFMNHIKEKNEVETYKELELKPKPTIKFEKYEPIINISDKKYSDYNTYEPFDTSIITKRMNNIMVAIIILILLILIYCIFSYK